MTPAGTAEARAQPSVSVVVATNRGPANPFLQEALASLAGQTLPAAELILVDDGSPDPVRADHLPAGLPPTTVVRAAGSGPSRARNLGAARATGRYLAFLDDDDAWLPGRLAAHVAAMDADPGLVLTYCRMHSVDAQGRTIAPADQTAVTSVADVFRRQTAIILGNVVVRADAFRAVGGFDVSLRLAEDLDLILRVALEGRVALVGEGSLVAYRDHGQNATSRHRELATSIREVLRRHRWAAERRDDADVRSALTQSIAANDRFAAWSAARAARRRLRERDVRGAVGELAWALRFAPRAPASWAWRRLRPPAGR